jgi:hypothetical protein
VIDGGAGRRRRWQRTRTAWNERSAEAEAVDEERQDKVNKHERVHGDGDKAEMVMQRMAR